MEKFSIVIITLNEEKSIERCLNSVSGLSDDIIVVDSGSTDKTKEICEKYSVNFVYNPFKDYSNQKNFANSLAKYDYVFSIDADEFLSDDLYQSIFNISFGSDNAVFSMNRLNFHSGVPIKHGGWYPDNKKRIWNKKFGQWQGRIHESLAFSADPSSISLLKGDLLHYTYENKEAHLKQARKYGLLNAENDFLKGRKTFYLKVIFAPIVRFLTVYILRLGFLDGRLGFFIAKTTAMSTYLRYKNLYNFQKNPQN